ncbi:DUF4160 domain-containing protein [Methylobacterium sp. J-076]|uniref:DUF4160 domain-containing protein n=1 Tax=Methylobacterium sp. J-076 TaxID=2836655 RepID=UPI001FBBE617|nr:DUF4160 domain-containing protein [Methylobacterium sp. J-076]MCJ2012579.1 DUF4160 domain-containing protein [Methylobacterium sp. J-076]
MPTVHRCDGFRIDIRSRDHNPPHFHMIGPDFHALVSIRTLEVLEGTYTRKALAEAVAWAGQRTDALMSEWRRLNERD